MRPATETELAEMIRSANAPLAIRGGGTRTIGRAVQGERLETSGLTGISLYEPGALTLVAGAGTPLAEIDAALAGEGQRLPFEPPDLRGLLGAHGQSTIGGVVAANASGPRRVQAGACRDSLIGVRFVDGSGTVVKNGGRVMKNVTGYDLVKLMAGSYGTLGVLTEVSFKVLPAPEAEATLLLSGLDPVRAVEAMSAALGSPFEVTGAARLVDGTTAFRVEGLEMSVRYRVGRLADLLRRWGAAQVEEGATSADRWKAIRDVKAFHGREGDVWRLSVAPSTAPEIVDRLGAEAVQLDWGGGLIWALVAEGTDLRAQLGPTAGHTMLVRASETIRALVPAFPPEAAPIAALTRGLRAKFDPRGLLNPGLMD